MKKSLGAVAVAAAMALSLSACSGSSSSEESTTTPLAQITSTSILSMYKAGRREMYGHRFPDGMRPNQKLPQTILTPTSKAFDAGHDEDRTERAGDAERLQAVDDARGGGGGDVEQQRVWID